MPRALFFYLFIFLAAWPQLAFAEKRVALVIGNGAYQNGDQLPNPTRDADAIANVLSTTGFEVVLHKDLNTKDFIQALKAFKKIADESEIAVVFYAGHAVQIRNTNYLIPVDAALDDEEDALYWNQGVPLDKILQTVDSTKRLRVVILDACRANPFVRKIRSRGLGQLAPQAGLARVDEALIRETRARDTLIAYATTVGALAADGDGDHSPFTEALLKHLAEPGLDIWRMFGKVRDDVRQSTRMEQDPFYYGTLGGEGIALVPTPAVPQTQAAPEVKGDEELVQRVLRQVQALQGAEAKKADEQRAQQEAEAKRKAEAEQAAAKRKADEQRAQQEAEAKRKAEAEQAAAKRNAEHAAQAAEAGRKAEAGQAAEAGRKAEEARQAAEAKRKAEEAEQAADAKRKAEQAQQAAEAKRKAEQAEQAAEAKRKAEDAQQAAEAKRKAEAEQAEAKRKAAEVEQAAEAKRKAAEAEQAPTAAAPTPTPPTADSPASPKPVAGSTLPASVAETQTTTPAPAASAPGESAVGQLAAIEPAQAPTELKPVVPTADKSRVPVGADRADYVKQVQKALKEYNCYGGKINGDVDDASAALSRFATNYKGMIRQINLPSATLRDYEEWLNWSKDLQKFSCPSVEPPAGTESQTPRKVQKQHEEPQETDKGTHGRSKEARPTPDRERRQAREQRSSPGRSYSPGRTSGGGGGGTMIGVGN